KNIKWIVIICEITTAVLYAQNLNIRRYSIEDGLIQSQVRAIIQDKEGLIWFGTGEGISRFDGREFINYNRKDGLASNFIESAFCDHNDKLWFGHFNGSITKFDKTTQCFERIVVYPHTARTSKAPVYRIIEDYNLDKWFVTYGLGLFHITDDSVVNITSKNGLLCEKLNDIIQLPDSSYWISSDKGVNILYYNQKHNNNVCDTLKSDPFWPDTPVQTLFLDSKQNIWAEASNGLYKISEKMDGENYLVEFYDKSVGFNSDDIRDIIEDHAGNLWISTGDHGIFRLSNKENKSDLANFRHFTAQNGIGSDFLNTVYEDNENNIWIGTDGSGAARLRDLGIEVYDKTDGLINECIWTILQEDINTVWVGHDLGMSRLSFFGNDDGKYEVKNYLYFNNEKINHVLDISQDNKNNIWFFSLTHQPIVLDHKNKKMKIMDLEKKYGYKNAITMAADNEGNLWFGSRTNGILKVNPALTEGKLFTEENGEITSSIINTIYKDREGQLWFGTENGGVLRFDGRQFHPYSTETGYAIISAVSIAEDKSGKMWFVSSEDQLFCLNGTAMTLMKGLKGLDGKTIYSVTAADDFLWIGTTNGLCKISLANLKTTHYGMRGGYPIFETNENASLIDKEGNLWFGTIRGVVKIMPTLLKSIPEAPTPVISKIQVFLQDMKLPENNKFEYNQNHLTFHFRSISLTAPEQVRYKYILKGFDDNWSPEIAVDYATYSNLNPGNYVFEVIAGNGRGEWNSIPARFAFEIKTPFWQTWWFYFVPLFLIGFLIFIFVLQRIKSMQNAKMILEKRVRLRTMELHEEKTKFEEANRALSAEKERLIVTLRSIGEGVITTDEDGKITMINSTAEMICEVKSEEVIGKLRESDGSVFNRLLWVSPSGFKYSRAD
ncbi:MAG: two-component regulator propeller domain-containing protein, partial [Calditrichaceae bacterium]